MNPVAMTITNPRKDYWPSCGSNQRPPVLKSATLPTELWGSTKKKKTRKLGLLKPPSEAFRLRIAKTLGSVVKSKMNEDITYSFPPV